MKNKAKKTIKTVGITLLLIFILITCILANPQKAFAADVVVSGNCGANGSNLTWAIDRDRVLTINGTGEMADYQNIVSPPWIAYENMFSTVVIGDGVTSIGDYAFYTIEVTSVTIGSGVKTIGTSAFQSTDLTSVSIPDSVTTIDMNAFYECDQLRSVSMGKGVISIGYQAFAGCTNLIDVMMSDSVTSLGGYAFYNCTGLTEITIPESVTSIGMQAFSGCSRLTSITIPENVISIGRSAFGWTGLAEINYYAASLADLGEDDNIFTAAGTSGSGISVNFGETVQRIPAYLFAVLSNASNRPNITSVTLSSSVASIGDYAFYGLSGLTDVYFYGTEAEWNAISIGNGNTSLTGANIHFSSSSIVASGTCGINGDNLTWTLDEDGVLTISGEGEMADYTASVNTPWYSYRSSINNISIESGITSIGSCSFAGTNNTITSLTIPDTVTSIASSAFENTRFYNLSTGDGVKTIGTRAFYNSEIRELTIGINVESIASNAFTGGYYGLKLNYNARNLTEYVYDSFIFTKGITVYIGENVATFPACFMGYVSSLVLDPNNSDLALDDAVLYSNTHKKVYICLSSFEGVLELPDTVKSIGRAAFYNCTGLTDINIPEGVTEIGDYTFYKCAGLTAIDLPESIDTIGSYAFYGLEDLESITIPENVTTIGAHAFEDCMGLIAINYNARNLVVVNSYNYNAFLRAGKNKNGIALTFGDSVESIPSNLFRVTGGYSERDYPNIKTVFIGDNVKTIGNNVFADLEIVELTIGKNVTSIGGNAFGGLNNLSTIYYNAINLSDLDEYLFGGEFYVPGSTETTVIVGNCVERLPDNLFLASINYGEHDCIDVNKVIFLGNKPDHGTYTFYKNTFNAYYPYGNRTWDEKPTLGLYNDITWIAYSQGEPVSAEVVCMPDRTEYEKGSVLDPTGLVLDVLFSDGCVERHEYPEIDIVDYDFSTIGEKPVVVGYNGAKTTIYVTVFEYMETVIDSSYYPESTHPYQNNLNETYTYSYPGAVKIEFTFSDDTSVENQMDYLYVYDSNGALIASYTRKEAAGQTVVVSGNSFSIRLESDESETDYGFSLDSIVVMTKNLPIRFATSISLDSQIALNAYIGQLFSGSEPNEYIAKVFVNGECNSSTPFSTLNGYNFTVDGVASDYYYLKITELPAKMMADEFIVKIYRNGSEVAHETYSIRNYCESRLKDGSGASAKNKLLCRATLTYGAEAQKHFGYKTDDLADKNIQRVSLTDIPADYAVSNDPTLKGISKVGTSGSFEAQVFLNLYFVPETGYGLDDFTFSAKLNGKACDVTPAVLSNGYIHLKMPSVVAKDLGTNFEITVTNKTTGASSTWYRSAMNYAYITANGNASATMKNLVKALYQYYLAAK